MYALNRVMRFGGPADSSGHWQEDDLQSDGGVALTCPETLLTLDQIYEGRAPLRVKELEAILAAFGLYAIVAYNVSRRFNEIAIRGALGATQVRSRGEPRSARRERNWDRSCSRARVFDTRFCESGTMPPEQWNRFAMTVLPKSRSASELKIGLEFSVRVPADSDMGTVAGRSQGWQIELYSARCWG